MLLVLRMNRQMNERVRRLDREAGCVTAHGLFWLFINNVCGFFFRFGEINVPWDKLLPKTLILDFLLCFAFVCVCVCLCCCCCFVLFVVLVAVGWLVYVLPSGSFIIVGRLFK